MDNDLVIYQLNAQSADKLDERRDATTRSHGGMCVVVATGAAGTFGQFPLVSAVLSLFLVIIALSWSATLDSLTAKLTAKSSLLANMEADGKVPGNFLLRERECWEEIGKRPLHAAAKKAPTAFICLGAAGFIATVASQICSLILR